MSGEIDYAAVLADLERKRDELDRAIAAIRPFAGQGGGSPEGGAPGGGGPNSSGRGEAPRELRSDTFFNMKAPEAVRTYLAHAKRPQTVRESRRLHQRRQGSLQQPVHGDPVDGEGQRRREGTRQVGARRLVSDPP
jgi:hypothetical protein